jgi:hypothetical protein
MARDSMYVAGMLGLTPVVQEYLVTQKHYSVGEAGVYASLIGGVLAAVPSHPFDIAKTCMQGDLAQRTYTTMASTLASLYRQGGIRRISSGCFWRTINITATIYIANECRVRLSPIFSKL